MSGLLQMTGQLWRPATPSFLRACSSPSGPIAHLHQQGPSHSAVVHEQALPQSQTQVAPVEPSSFLSRTKTTPAQTSPPPNNEPTSLDTLISQIPLVQTLRQSHHFYRESRPHLVLPPAIRQHHFVGGSLAGSGKLALAPYMWTSTSTSTSSPKSRAQTPTNTRTSNVVSVFHIGRDLCGHPGFVHGGLLSVLFDEVFARCVSAAFPSGLGMTANLNVDFRKPALPDRMYVLRVQTVQVEGRKAWVEGRMRYLPLALPVPLPLEAHSVVPDEELLREDGEGAVMVAEAKALFVEPKFADSMVSIYKN